MGTGAIRILREVVIPSSPAVGETDRLVAITYQVPARPPQVILIRAEDLPDLAWREQNPGSEEVPPSVQQQGDRERRNRILQKLSRGESSPPRSI